MATETKLIKLKSLLANITSGAVVSINSNEFILAEDQIITVNPDVYDFVVDETWDFLVLACDGIWDILSNQDVVSFVVDRIGQGYEPDDICEALLTLCLQRNSSSSFRRAPGQTSA